MAKYFCEYCGEEFSSIQNLTGYKCSKHPIGYHNGYHKLYEGGEKSEYFCKYCGEKFSSIRNLTGYKCSKHPNGYHNGYHAPSMV